MLTHRGKTILGDIPDDWCREQLRRLLIENHGGDWGEEEGELALRVLRSTNFSDRTILDLTDVAVRRFPTAKAVDWTLRPGDILIERSGGGPTQPVGRVGYIGSELEAYWFSNFVQLLRPDSGAVDPEFLSWVLLELNRSGAVYRLQFQTTQMRNLDFRDYLRVFLPRPSRAEQERIARVLRTVNEAITIAQEKCAASRRLKTALMQALFTSGMPRRHSSFISAQIFRHRFSVPDSWDLAPLKRSVVGIEYGTNAPSNNQGHGFPVIAIPEVIASRFRLGNCSYAELPPEEAAALRLQPDDVLLIRTNGNAEYIGTSTVIGNEALGTHMVFASYLIRVRTDSDRLSGRYLNYFLRSPLGRRMCLAMANTSAGNHNLGARSIKQFLLPRPSPDEQAEIVELIDAAEDAIEAADFELTAVETLQRSLLQNLTTGKVRLRAQALQAHA